VNPVTTDIVAKLWNLCNILKDDGVTYHQYVTELTYLLFLKLAKETNTERLIPANYRWEKLEQKTPAERLSFYNSALKALSKNRNPLIRDIYASAISSIKKSASLSRLVSEIDKLEWFNTQKEQLGDLYEGLLEKNSSEKKSGAGQYFTPRPLIESIVAVMRPRLRDIIQDPAAGTGGFLITANKHLLENENPESWTEQQRQKYTSNTFYGMEHVQETHRLALMNLILHSLDYAPQAAGIRYGDTLSADGAALPKATLMLSNPPFGTKSGGGVPIGRDFEFPTSNKQFCFLQHIYESLTANGRAAVVLPDNVLFEGNIGKQIRADLMDKCNLHTILRLPTGIFYAQGVKTNVLFFTRGTTNKNNTKEVWIYDLRTNMPQYGKRTQLIREHFAEFEIAFGTDPLGKPKSLAKRTDTGEQGKFRKFSRQYIFDRNDSLDISWLKDENEENSADLPEPSVLAQSAMTELKAALKDIQSILEALGEDLELVAA
jgi:type I restriction enzyme M protein